MLDFLTCCVCWRVFCLCTVKMHVKLITRFYRVSFFKITFKYLNWWNVYTKTRDCVQLLGRSVNIVAPWWPLAQKNPRSAISVSVRIYAGVSSPVCDVTVKATVVSKSSLIWGSAAQGRPLTFHVTLARSLSYSCGHQAESHTVNNPRCRLRKQNHSDCGSLRLREFKKKKSFKSPQTAIDLDPAAQPFSTVWTSHLNIHFDKVIFIMPVVEQFFFFFFFLNQSGAVGGNFPLKFHHFSRLYCLFSLAVSSLSLTFTTHTCQLWGAACLKYRGFGV